MDQVKVSRDGKVAVVTLQRGKVNALNHATVKTLVSRFAELEQDPQVRAVVLTGEGKFFSFGFDIPEFLSYSREEFTFYLQDFTSLYTKVYLFPKPVIAALNGHTIAGACMLATACDRRIMASGSGKISLNEITFGASVFAGCVAMLKGCIGHRNAENVLYSGAMYKPEQALALRLVDRVTRAEELLADATAEAREMASQDGVAFKSIKMLLRKPVADEMQRREADSIKEFVDIWYSKDTWARLKKIEIRR